MDFTRIRNFTATVQRHLLRVFLKKNDIVLDIGCEAFRFYDELVKRQTAAYIGIDPEFKKVNDLYVAEADRRLAGVRSPVYTSFKQMPLDSIFKAEHRATLVTCFSTVEQFFASEKQARHFFQTVKQNIGTGGRLVCTFRSGKALLEPLKKHNRIPPLKRRRLDECFGTSLGDLCQEGAYRNLANESYLTYLNVFIKLAEESGFAPIHFYCDEFLEGFFQKEDAKREFKHFNPLRLNNAAKFVDAREIRECASYVCIVLEEALGNQRILNLLQQVKSRGII